MGEMVVLTILAVQKWLAFTIRYRSDSGCRELLSHAVIPDSFYRESILVFSIQKTLVSGTRLC